MTLRTCSEVISFIWKLEGESADFYDGLSRKYGQNPEMFLDYINENGKNVTHLEKSYRAFISDALEGCFTFNIEPAAYVFGREVTGNGSYPEALNRAVAMEKKLIALYTEAARQSEDLMAGMTGVFTAIAKKKIRRLDALGSCIEKI